MEIKKYIDLNGLAKFLDNFKGLFASKTELNEKLEEKADKSHSHKISDVSNLQSALDAKANSSHGTHVTYSTTNPVMDGTASVGSTTTVARSDHRHPTDTSRASQTSLDSHTGNTTAHITSAERANWNTAYTHSQTTHAPSNAEPNQNAFSNVKIGDVTIAADIKTDTLTLVAGNNITLTPDAANDKVTITAKDTTYTLGSFGITSTAAEINKLDGVTVSTSEINSLDGITDNIQTQLDAITSTVDNKKAKRVSLTGQCQTTSYRTSVIALCKAPTNSSCGNASNSYSSGQLTFARSNGLYAPVMATISMSSSHGATNQVRVRYLCSSGFSIFKPCTFIYNGVTYGGLEVKTSDAEAHNVTFVGETSFDIFALDIYDSNKKVILNEEVYNSISYDNPVIESGWKDTGNTIITSANIGSQSVASAVKDGSSNVITSTYETKTDASNKLSEAKTYADNAANKVKNDLLNGAGGAYDTLKELGDLIDDNADAIDALETVAAGKANKTHTHAISDITNLQTTLNNKSDSSHTHNNIVSRGNTTAETETTRPSISGISMTQAYNNGYATTYGNILNLKGQGDGQLLIGWSGTSGAHAPVYVRSKRDVAEANWSDWAQVYTTAHKPTATDIGAAASSHTHKVANVSDLTASATELNYVKGVTSEIQSQLDGKASSSHNHSASNITSGTLSSDRLSTVPIAKGGTGATTATGALANLGITATAAELNKLDGVTATTTELNYVDGVTSNVQTQLDGKSSTSHTHNYAGSSSVGGSATSAVKLQTARSIALGNDLTGSANFDGSGNITISAKHYNANVNSGNKSNYPYHRFAYRGSKTSPVASQYNDTDAIFCIRETYNGGGYGVLKVSLRTNNSTTTSQASATWLARYNFALDDVKIGLYNVTGATYADLYLKVGTYARTTVIQLEGNRSWTLVSSSEVNDTTTTDAKTSTECYVSIETAATTLHGQAYSSIISSVDGGQVNYANSAGSATTSSTCSGNSATATKLSLARTISLTGDVTGSTSFDGSGNVSITAAVADDSHNHIISNIDGLQSALDGKSATSHNHNSAYVSKSLQFTADSGAHKLSYTKDSGKNILTEIAALSTGFYTVYSQSGTDGNPKTTEAWRFMVHKTGATTGWVQGYGSLGSVYTNYHDGDSGWRGWRCVWDNDPDPLWSGAMYMSSPNSTPQTVKPTKKLSECRTGWLLLWSDYDPGSGSNDADFATTIIPKNNPSGGKWGGKSFLCDIPRYVGSNTDDVDTERRIIKPIYVHDDRIEGSYQNDKDERNDVVLRAVYEI